MTPEERKAHDQLRQRRAELESHRPVEPWVPPPPWISP
jgi:hypothetical protein